MEITDTKRVSFKCENDVYKQLEYLKTFYDAKRDEVLSTVITERYKQIIADLALQAGLLEKEKKVEIHLNKTDFGSTDGYNVFERICEKLDAKGDDGQVSSVKSLIIEVKDIKVLKR